MSCTCLRMGDTRRQVGAAVKILLSSVIHKSEYGILYGSNYKEKESMEEFYE